MYLAIIGDHFKKLLMNFFEPIFKEEDLTLCEVPVPNGYPQSQTHSGVVAYSGRVFLTTSPFPQIRCSKLKSHFRALSLRLTKGMWPPIYGDNCENPMLYWGEKGSDAPISFTPFKGNPFINIPPSLYGYPAFNSDPDIFREGNKLYVLNREYIRNYPPGGNIGDVLTRLDMVTFRITDKGADYERCQIIKEEHYSITSPCLAKWNGKYRLIYVDTQSYNEAGADCHLYYESSEDIHGTYSNRIEICIDGGDYTPWHLSVFQHKGQMYAVVACVYKGEPQRLYQMLGVFKDDLSKLTIFQRPLISIPSYRGSAYISEGGEFILYSTTDKYPLSSSKSVDGKDVVLVKMNFKTLLKEISDVK